MKVSVSQNSFPVFIFKSIYDTPINSSSAGRLLRAHQPSCSVVAIGSPVS